MQLHKKERQGQEVPYIAYDPTNPTGGLSNGRYRIEGPGMHGASPSKPEPHYCYENRAITRLIVFDPKTVALQTRHGFTLIELVGVLAILGILAGIIAPYFIGQINSTVQAGEMDNLKSIAKGVAIYFKRNRDWPATLATLNPDYAPFATAQLSVNDRTFTRYFFAHPDTSSFVNSTGVAESDLQDLRFLVISDISTNAAPTITNATQFNTWWNTDETSTPNRKIYRGHLGHMMYLVSLSAAGAGGSYQIDGVATSSGGGTLTAHSRYHVVGTPIKLDEADTYATPELEFSLASDVAYVFDPDCATGGQWHPLGLGCGVSGAASGGSFTQLTSTSTDTINSGTYNVLAGMTTTPLAGTYYVSFSGYMKQRDEEKGCSYAIFQDGTIISHTQRELEMKSDNDEHSIHTQAIVSVDGTETIDVRAKENNGKDCYFYDRSLILHD